MNTNKVNISKWQKYIYIYIYIYRKSASRFSRGTVLNTLKQSRINIMRGKKDVSTFPDKPVYKPIKPLKSEAIHKTGLLEI